MASYKILTKPSAAKEIEAAPKNERLRIVRRIQAPSSEPRQPGCEKLTGQDKYRVRQRQYQIVYSISEVELTELVVKIGHRREVYRQDI